MLVLELIPPRPEEHEDLVQLFLADSIEVEEVEVLENARLDDVSTPTLRKKNHNIPRQVRTRP